MNNAVPAVVLTCYLFICASLASAQSTEMSWAHAVEVLGNAMLLTYERSAHSPSCALRAIRTLPELRRAKIGDDQNRHVSIPGGRYSGH